MRRFNIVTISLGLAGLGLSYGCHSSGPYSESTPNAAQPASFTSAEMQISRGATVYANNCAACHGDAAQGTRRAPALVGSGALDEFHSAMDIAVFATENMPPSKTKREMLTEQDYWAVLAFALSANGVGLEEPVGPDNASGIILNP